MEPEEDEVSLVVESCNLSTNKLRVLWEESSKQTADGVSQTSGEVIEDDLWRVFGWVFTSSLRRVNGTMKLASCMGQNR